MFAFYYIFIRVGVETSCRTKWRSESLKKIQIKLILNLKVNLY